LADELANGSVALHRLGRMGLIQFSGADAETFLHGQLTCDVAGLADGWSSYGAYCTAQGRVLANFLLWRVGSEYWMQLPRALAAPIHKRLSMYILRAKVKANDASERHTVLGITGDDASSVMAGVFGDAPGTLHEVRQSADATLIRLAPDRFEIVAPAESTTRICEALKAHARETDAAHWDRLEIRAGIPWITPPTQEQFVPQMVNLDLIGAVSLSKGCYPGQEIVARTHYRGQLKQRMFLARLAVDDGVHAGDRLYSAELGDQSSGMIVNAVRSPEGGHDVLAVVYLSSTEKGDVHWKALDGPRLEFGPLPYAVR